MNIENEIINLKLRIEKLEELLKVNKEVKPEPAKPKTTRDTTRYIFNGKVYPKNKLVLAVVKSYVQQHNPTLFELQLSFDKSLQGSLNVVEDYETAKQIKDCSKRYFCKPEDLLILKDGVTAVVCTQWGIFNIVKFIKHSQNLGFEIQSI